MSTRCQENLLKTAEMLATKCLAENRYPKDVAGEWLVVYPLVSPCYTLSELVDAIDAVMTENACDD
ncbi:hypothetical protein [Victivallis sp. Marseille-Q1083]|uniref:hypothetical protein n=1 Tax=Victivallis sp. Marseille-Q1083 TaxID=2717288 RepID=UPI00158A999C|nr:hypothetical protein [Victivallis sp. Marseille-Q1083]